MVAQLRGLSFRRQGRVMIPDGDRVIGNQAADDVARWLGFKSTADYFDRLSKERRRIFRRALTPRSSLTAPGQVPRTDDEAARP